MKLFPKSIGKKTIEELKKEKKTCLILTILWGLGLVGLAGTNLHGHPWWTVSLIFFVAFVLRYNVVALAIGLKKEMQELKDRIAKLE